MSKANDFFYSLPDMMKQPGHTGKDTDINAVLMTLIDNQNKLIDYITDLHDMHRSLLETVYEICPGLMVIEEVADDQERKQLLRKYMNTAVDSDNDDDVLDWVNENVN